MIGIVFILLWLGPLGLGTADAAVPAGKVVGISGQCFVQADGKRTPLQLGDAVHVADIVDVPAGAKLKLRMNDGSVLSVAPGSQLTIAAYTVDADGKRHEVELSLTQGLLRAVVAPVETPAAFEVKTAVGVTAVRSTDWFVEAQPGTTAVSVLAGSVSLTSNATGAAVIVPARSAASVAAGQDPTTPRPWRQVEMNALIARTEPAPPPRRRAPPVHKPSERAYQPTENDTPQQQGEPPGYSAAPRGYDASPGGGYQPYPRGGYGPRGPGGYPGGEYGSRPSGMYPPAPGGYGRNPGGTVSPLPGPRGYQ